MRPESINNAYARYKYLLDCLRDKSLVATSDITFLSGQRKFSELSVKKRFSALSLNTLKAAANECLADKAPDGYGFKYLDRLRAELYSAVKDRAIARTEKGQQKRSQTLLKRASEEKAQAEYLNVVFTKAYSELLATIHALAGDLQVPDRTRARISNIVNRHLEVYGTILQPDLNAQQGELSIIKGSKD